MYSSGALSFLVSARRMFNRCSTVVQPLFNCRSTVVQPDLQSGCFLKYRQIANLPERINLPERAILLERINLPEQSQNNVILYATILQIMNRKLVIIAMTLVFSFQAYASAPDSDTSSVEQSVAEAISDTVYVVYVDRAYPMGHGSLFLTDRYSLSVDKETAVSRLPYFGRAYSIPYGGGDGLMFEGRIEDYAVKEGRKAEKEISFSVKTDEDKFEFHLTVFPNGSASVSVISTNRQPIGFNGTLMKK